MTPEGGFQKPGQSDGGNEDRETHAEKQVVGWAENSASNVPAAARKSGGLNVYI